MSKAVKNIMVRVIRRRMEAGEDIEDILKSYSKLTPEEKKEEFQSADNMVAGWNFFYFTGNCFPVK